MTKKKGPTKNGRNGQNNRNGKGIVFETHHIIPTSRGGSDNDGNKIRIPAVPHGFFHEKFANRKPEEVIELLVHEYWTDRWQYVFEAFKRYHVDIPNEFQRGYYRMPKKLSLTTCIQMGKGEHWYGGLLKNVPPGQIRLYHQLFANRRPEEIIEFLVYEFWNGQWSHVFAALKRYRVSVPQEFQKRKCTIKKSPKSTLNETQC